MKTLPLNTTLGSATLYFGDCYSKLEDLLPEDSVLLTDRNVYALYKEQMPDIPRIILEPGESHKNLKSVERVLEKLLEYKVNRRGFLLGYGGGMITDLAGFAASVYLRGIPFGYVSTSLLGQLDASIGGKTGVNFQGLKNMIGLFRHPDFVICDPLFLHTLPDLDFQSGLGELLKHALAFDADLWTEIHTTADATNIRKSEKWASWTERSVRLKAGIVESDVLEKGDRVLLNLGHTFGHAYESLTGMPHGICVFQGLKDAIRISETLQLLPRKEAGELLTSMEKLRIPGMSLPSADQVLEVISYDKKGGGEKLRFIGLEACGKALIYPLALQELSAIYKTLR